MSTPQPDSTTRTHPLLDAARSVLIAHRQREDGRDEQTVNLPLAVGADLARATALSTDARVQQIISFEPMRWDAQAYEHEVWRDLARASDRVRSVQRLYVVPHKGLADEALEDQIARDREAGVEPRLLFVSSIPDELRASLPAVSWLIDGAGTVVLPANALSTDTASWRVSLRQTDASTAAATFEALWDRAHPDLSHLAATLDLEEPLVLSADLIHDVATVLCAGDHIDPNGCGWYHGSWQYLRLLDLVSTPTWHADFYRSQLAEALARVSNPRVLITGTADYSVLAYVIAAAQAVGSTPSIAVVDLCSTPLFACRWYAKRTGFDIATSSEDFLASNLGVANQTWDVICTDAFLTRFTDDERRAVVQRWERMLNPTGRLITTVRIHSRTQTARDVSEAVSAFKERALLRSYRWVPFISATPTAIATLSETYALQMVSHPIGNEQDVLALLEGGTLNRLHLEIAEVPGELYPTAYARIVLEKP